MVGLGGNLNGPLGGPADYLEAAIRHLEQEDGLQLLARSRFYRSAPWGREDQAEFVNAVVSIASNPGPRSLLDRLLGVEDVLGRHRAERWGPRLIDLDLLTFDGVETEEDGLILPHPRMHQRAFVLVPLLELESGFVIPGKGRAIDFLDLIGDSQRVEAL